MNLKLIVFNIVAQATASAGAGCLGIWSELKSPRLLVVGTALCGFSAGWCLSWIVQLSINAFIP